MNRNQLYRKILFLDFKLITLSSILIVFFFALTIGLSFKEGMQIFVREWIVIAFPVLATVGIIFLFRIRFKGLASYLTAILLPFLFILITWTGVNYGSGFLKEFINKSGIDISYLWVPIPCLFAAFINLFSIFQVRRTFRYS